MVTKNKIKNILPAGSGISKAELVDMIQQLTEKYNNGFVKQRHVVIGLFISAGLTYKSAVYSFEKIQERRSHKPITDPCGTCGEQWENTLEVCPHCGEDLPF